MDAPENILKQIRMLVTDADGTLMGRRPEFEQYRAFRARINDLRTSTGALWVVCTGRSLGSYKRLFSPMRMFGISPDYVIVEHAYIYECRTWGHLPHWMWNLSVVWLQWKDDLALRRALPKLRRAVLSRNPFARVTYSDGGRVCFRFDDEGATGFGADILRTEARPYRYLQVFQGICEAEVRVIPFTKGLAVSELARHLGIANPHILVIGDGHNDISMMEMSPPCRTACPSNAAPEVVEVVHRTHGHIAAERSLGGVMEILSAYESGRGNDRLPDDWIGTGRSFHQPKEHAGIRGLGTFIMLAVVVYVTLLVLSTFCHFPGRKTIRKPFQALIEVVRPVFGTGTNQGNTNDQNRVHRSR